MIRVIVADDHAVVRRGLKDTLEDEPDIRVVAEAADGREALEAARKPGWDVLVLDISMPQMSGLEVIERLRLGRPRIPALVLSIHPEKQLAVRALQAGAQGYVTKESAAAELVKAVRAVAAGDRYISKSLAESLASLVVDDGQRPLHEKLSAREFRVMCLMASGKSTNEIAQTLFLSPKTVATYRTRLMDKTKLDSIAAITRYVVENKLVD